MRYKLLQKKSIGKTKACSKHLRHIAIEKDIFSELNRCILQIFLKYIKLVIPEILFILVLSSFNFYLKIMWLLANKITITKQKFLTAPPLLAKTFMKSIPQHPLTHTRTHTHTHTQTHTHKHTLPQNFLLAFIDKLWKIQKIRILKKKNCWRYHHFTHAYQKPQSYEVQFLRYTVKQNFLWFWVIFCPSP